MGGKPVDLGLAGDHMHPCPESSSQRCGNIVGTQMHPNNDINHPPCTRHYFVTPSIPSLPALDPLNQKSHRPFSRSAAACLFPRCFNVYTLSLWILRSILPNLSFFLRPHLTSSYRPPSFFLSFFSTHVSGLVISQTNYNSSLYSALASIVPSPWARIPFSPLASCLRRTGPLWS